MHRAVLCLFLFIALAVTTPVTARGAKNSFGLDITGKHANGCLIVRTSTGKAAQCGIRQMDLICSARDLNLTADSMHSLREPTPCSVFTVRHHTNPCLLIPRSHWVAKEKNDKFDTGLRLKITKLKHASDPNLSTNHFTIESVSAGSLASNYAIFPGDLIRSIDGHLLMRKNHDEVKRMLSGDLTGALELCLWSKEIELSELPALFTSGAPGSINWNVLVFSVIFGAFVIGVLLRTKQENTAKNEVQTAPATVPAPQGQEQKQDQDPAPKYFKRPPRPPPLTDQADTAKHKVPPAPDADGSKVLPGPDPALCPTVSLKADGSKVLLILTKDKDAKWGDGEAQLLEIFNENDRKRNFIEKSDNCAMLIQNKYHEHWARRIYDYFHICGSFQYHKVLQVFQENRLKECKDLVSLYCNLTTRRSDNAVDTMTKQDRQNNDAVASSAFDVFVEIANIPAMVQKQKDFEKDFGSDSENFKGLLDLSLHAICALAVQAHTQHKLQRKAEQRGIFDLLFGMWQQTIREDSELEERVLECFYYLTLTNYRLQKKFKIMCERSDWTQARISSFNKTKKTFNLQHIFDIDKHQQDLERQACTPYQQHEGPSDQFMTVAMQGNTHIGATSYAYACARSFVHCLRSVGAAKTPIISEDRTGDNDREFKLAVRWIVCGDLLHDDGGLNPIDNRPDDWPGMSFGGGCVYEVMSMLLKEYAPRRWPQHNIPGGLFKGMELVEQFLGDKVDDCVKVIEQALYVDHQEPCLVLDVACMNSHPEPPFQTNHANCICDAEEAEGYKIFLKDANQVAPLVFPSVTPGMFSSDGYIGHGPRIIWIRPNLDRIRVFTPTALHYQCARNNVGQVQNLLDHNADVNAKTRIQNRTPMEVLSSRCGNGADDESAAAIRKLLSFFLRLSAPPPALGRGSVEGTALVPAGIVNAAAVTPLLPNIPPALVPDIAAGGQFWKRRADDSPIDQILEKPGFTLEELLDEDSIVQKSKTENEKLLAFLAREEVLAKLIQYVITAKKAGTEDKVKLKYPYIASELLSLELESIYGPILSSEKLSRSLFGFLSSASVADSLLCGYFQKVVSQLLSKSPVQCIGRIKQLNVVGGLIDNINSFAMAELLLLLASLPEDPKVSVHLPGDALQWLAESNFVQRMVGLLHSADPDAQSHAHFVLTGLIRSSQLRTPSVITHAVVGRLTVENVFQGINANGFAASSASLGLVVELISKCVAETSKDDGNKQCADFVSVIVSVIVGQLDALVAFVRSEAPASNLISVTTTIRTQQPLMGSARLRIVEALGHMLRLRNPEAQQACLGRNIFVECLKLFPRYRWHGVLHNTVLNMATFVTSSPEMLEAALKGGLLQAITAAARQDMQDGKRHRLPYMAQVVKIVVALKDTAKNDERVRLAMESDKDFKEVLEQSIEPSLSSEDVVIAGVGKTDIKAAAVKPKLGEITCINPASGEKHIGIVMPEGKVRDSQTKDVHGQESWLSLKLPKQKAV